MSNSPSWHHEVVPNVNDPDLAPRRSCPDLEEGGAAAWGAEEAPARGFFAQHKFAVIVSVIILAIVVVVLYVYLTRRGGEDKKAGGAQEGPPPPPGRRLTSGS